MEEERHLREECERIGMEYSGEGGLNADSTNADAANRKETMADKAKRIWQIGQEEWISEVAAILNLPAVIEQFEDVMLWGMDKLEKLLENRRKIEYAKTQY